MPSILLVLGFLSFLRNLSFSRHHTVILWCISSFILVNEHYFLIFIVVVFHSLNHIQLLVSPWTAAHQASLAFTVSQNLLRFMSIELVMLSNYLILSCPLLLLPSVFPSIRVFFSELALHTRWPKNWSFCFSISPSSEYSGSTCFKMDWLGLLALPCSLF